MILVVGLVLLCWIYRQFIELIPLTDLGLVKIRQIARVEGGDWMAATFARGGLTRAAWRRLARKHVAVLREGIQGLADPIASVRPGR